MLLIINSPHPNNEVCLDNLQAIILVYASGWGREKCK